MKKFKGSKGEWKSNDVDIKIEGELIATAHGFYDKERVYSYTPVTNANAELIADAGNTIQKCGLLPSELLEQRDRLLAALKELYVTINKDYGHFKNSYSASLEKAQTAINKTQ